MAIARPETINLIILTHQNKLGFHLVRFMCNGIPTFLPVDDLIPVCKDNHPVYLQMTDALWPLII
jgi:hypothetical protein